MGIKFTPVKTKNADGWPKLYNAVKNENWDEVLQQSTRNLNINPIRNINNPRNIFVKEQFKNENK